MGKREYESVRLIAVSTPSAWGRYQFFFRRWCWLNKLLINKKHNAPSAHQNTALNNHASSCHNERVGIKTKRISNRQHGAANIAPRRGLSTSRRWEKKLAAAPGKIKNNNPTSGCPAALNAPFTFSVNERHTTIKSTKQQTALAQLCLCFNRSSWHILYRTLFSPAGVQSDKVTRHSMPKTHPHDSYSRWYVMRLN